VLLELADSQTPIGRLRDGWRLRPNGGRSRGENGRKKRERVDDKTRCDSMRGTVEDDDVENSRRGGSRCQQTRPSRPPRVCAPEDAGRHRRRPDHGHRGLADGAVGGDRAAFTSPTTNREKNVATMVGERGGVEDTSQEGRKEQKEHIQYTSNQYTHILCQNNTVKQYKYHQIIQQSPLIATHQLNPIQRPLLTF